MSPEEQGLQPKTAVQKELSDMEYLKSKMVQAEVSSEDEDEEGSEDEAVNCEEGSEAEEEEDLPASPAQQESVSRGALPSSQRPQEAAGKVCMVSRCVCVSLSLKAKGEAGHGSHRVPAAFSLGV